jgi:hypothetical protein
MHLLFTVHEIAGKGLGSGEDCGKKKGRGLVFFLKWNVKKVATVVTPEAKGGVPC